MCGCVGEDEACVGVWVGVQVRMRHVWVGEGEACVGGCARMMHVWVCEDEACVGVRG